METEQTVGTDIKRHCNKMFSLNTHNMKKDNEAYNGHKE